MFQLAGIHNQTLYPRNMSPISERTRRNNSPQFVFEEATGTLDLTQGTGTQVQNCIRYRTYLPLYQFVQTASRMSLNHCYLLLFQENKPVASVFCFNKGINYNKLKHDLIAKLCTRLVLNGYEVAQQ